MINDVIKDVQHRMHGALDALHREFKTLRTGRANAVDARRHRGRLLRHADADRAGGVAEGSGAVADRRRAVGQVDGSARSRRPSATPTSASIPPATAR